MKPYQSTTHFDLPQPIYVLNTTFPILVEAACSLYLSPKPVMALELGTHPKLTQIADALVTAGLDEGIYDVDYPPRLQSSRKRFRKR